MAEHTPGPWEAHDDDGTGTLPCVLSDKVNAGGNFYVAQCNNFEDARLIAAAPALFAALERIKAETAGAAESSTPSRMLVETLHYIAANVVDQAREVPAHA